MEEEEIDAAEATFLIKKELFRNNPQKYGWLVYESFSLISEVEFRSDAEAWLKDRSELDDKVYDLADWADIYTTFVNWGKE